MRFKPLPSEDIIRYHGLMKIWNDETAVLSAGIDTHPARLEILYLVNKIDLLPFVLRDIYKYPHQCFPLLYDLVKNPPNIPSKYQGRISKIAEIWYEWGKENKII